MAKLSYNSSELNLAVRVNKRDAESVRRKLLRAGILDHTRAILRIGEIVEIPVIDKTVPRLEYVYQKNPVFRPLRLSLDIVRRSLREVIGERADNLRGWELLGDILVINLPFKDEDDKKMVGRRLVQFFPRVKTVVNRKEILNTFREPVVEVLYGSDTVTIHKEHGCRFKMDVSKVMFSAGNMEERRRMAYISDSEEVVLDMFAGVGQFTIPMAKHSRPARIIAIEKNPVAFNFLWENIKLNGLTNVEALLGDCRDKSPENTVDRVIMGYIFNTSTFLPYALKALRGSGVIHFHSLVRRGSEKKKEETLKKQVNDAGYETTRIKRRKVKSYSPRYNHLVFDLDVEKSTTPP